MDAPERGGVAAAVLKPWKAGEKIDVVARLIKAPGLGQQTSRRELDLPTQFLLAAQREADEAAARDSRLAPNARAADRADIPFLPTDPANSWNPVG